MNAQYLVPLLVTSVLISTFEANAAPEYPVWRSSESANQKNVAYWNDVRSLRHKLDTIIVPRIVLNEVTFDEAVNWLRKASIEHDPEGFGVQIYIRPGDRPPPETKDWQHPRTTCDFRNIPLYEAIRYIVGSFNREFRITSSGVEILPWPSYLGPDMPPLSMRVSRKLFSDVAGEIWRSEVPNKTSRKDLTSFFRSQGVEFPSGALCILYNDRSLLIRNTEENLPKCREVVEAREIATQPPGRPEYTPVWEGYTDFTEKELTELRRELQNIQLKNISIEGLAVDEAVARIASMTGASSSEDSSSPDAKLRILIRRDSASLRRNVQVLASEPAPRSFENGQATMINYTKEQASLLDVMRAIAAQAGMQLWFESADGNTKRVSLVDRDIAIPLEREEFPMSEAALSHAGFVVGQDPCSDTLTEPSSYIDTPSMLYARGTGRLTVEDTPENIRKLTRELDRAWREVEKLPISADADGGK